jgi:KDO2-lipid IV(A) lauroyltransferase
MAYNPTFRPKVTISKKSKQALDDALACGRGAIFVTGHIGNWELMAATLAQWGYPIHTVAKPSYDSRFTVLISKARAAFGVRAILRGDKGSASAMLRALRKNAVLGFLIDQDTDVPSVFAPFFGRPAKTPSAPAELALRTGAELVTGTIYRSATRGSHRIEISRVDAAATVEETTALFNQALEMRIRKHPLEWIWFHRRWKSTIAEVHIA